MSTKPSFFAELKRRNVLRAGALYAAAGWALTQAVTLDPRDADGWVARGLADASSDPPQHAQVQAEYRKALALDPNNADAHIEYALSLPVKPSLDEFRKAAQLDPDGTAAQFNLAFAFQDLGDWAQSVAAAEALTRLDPQDMDGAFLIAYARQQLHQYDLMAAAFDLVKPATPIDQQLVDTGRLVYGAVAHPELRPQALTALRKMSLHQSTNDVAPNLVLMYASLGQDTSMLKLLQAFCPPRSDFCADLAVNPWYARLRGDPRFQRLAQKYTTITLGEMPASAGSGAGP